MIAKDSHQPSAARRLGSLLRRAAPYVLNCCATAGLFSPMPVNYLTGQPEPELDDFSGPPLNRRERLAWAQLHRDLITPPVPGEPSASEDPSR